MKWIYSIKKYIRKTFLILSDEQESVINAEIAEIKEILEKESDILYRNERKYQQMHDEKCPHCGATDIVNKISRVQGDGSVNGSFSLGFGSVYGRMDIDTNEVNHCAKCGNQWKKYKFVFTSATKLLTSNLNDIGTHIEGRYSFAEKTYNNYKKYKAETIYSIINGNDIYRSDLYQSTIELSISTLRKYFKSVYDA